MFLGAVDLPSKSCIGTVFPKSIAAVYTGHINNTNDPVDSNPQSSFWTIEQAKEQAYLNFQAEF